MSFHLVSDAGGGHRYGEFDTMAEAIASGLMQATTGVDAPAFVVEEAGTSEVRLVAGYDDELGWVEVDPDEPVPVWWDKLSTDVREQLLANPRGHLTAGLRDALLRAGGPLVAAYWVEQGPESGSLDFAMSERDWLMRRSIIERF